MATSEASLPSASTKSADGVPPCQKTVQEMDEALHSYGCV
jgi:hypothetical protein